MDSDLLVLFGYYIAAVKNFKIKIWLMSNGTIEVIKGIKETSYGDK